MTSVNEPENAAISVPAEWDEERPLHRDGLVMHELDGEALMFDPVSSDTHRLNETALFIWRRCDGEHPVRCIAEELAAGYDVTIEEALQHVNQLLADLGDQGLLVNSTLAPAGRKAT